MLKILFIVLSVPVFAASLSFRTIAFLNMENGYHITDRGNKLVLSDAQGRVIAHGNVGPQNIITAKSVPTRSGTYTQATELTVELTSIDPLARSGRGFLKLCIPVNPNAPPQNMQCQFLSSLANERKETSATSGVNRVTHFDGTEVEFTVSNGNIDITSWYGVESMESSLALSGGGVFAPAVSFAHPVMAPMMQGKGANKDFQSPLVLDLDRDGSWDLINAWSASPKILFDLNGDGKKSRMGWVGCKDGLLWIDRDGNQKVSDGRELFSEYSFGYELESQVRRRFADGFKALAQYDANGDEVIDPSDKVFPYLRLWRDCNSDGISQKNEISTLADHGIEWIELFAEEQRESLHQSGNDVRLVSQYRHRSGKNARIADIWFRVRPEERSK